MTNHVKLGWACLLGCALAACGNEAVPGAGDPRCEHICESASPYEGYGHVCSESARATCLAECAVRIEGVDPLCASCLLEGASWSPTTDDALDAVYLCDPSADCPGARCTIMGYGGTCSYCDDDADARLECYRTAYPQTETEACESRYRPVLDCAAVCSS